MSDATQRIALMQQRLGTPSTIRGFFAGTLEAYQQSLSTEPMLILTALLAVYIVLGILYESLVHPLTIISTLPSASVGAILALMLFKIDLNVISIIGIVLLIGIVKKNAIMMIDFALVAERQEGKSTRDSIFEACMLRFRPILMTTMAALFGALPLAFGTGTGSELRRPLGITIVGGLIVSQMLTLYTTPVVYLFLDRAAACGSKEHATRCASGANSGGELARIEMSGRNVMTIFQRKSVGCRTRPWTTALSLMLLVMLSGCAVGPKYHPPAPPQPPAPDYKESPTQFKENEGWTVAQPSDSKLRGKWWEIFNDPELNALEEQLDINNQNIKQFFENFMEARAIVREARSQYFPTLAVAPSFSRSRTSGNLSTTPVNTTGGAAPKPQLQSTVYSLPLEASWEPDLWGKVRNTVREEQYAAQVSAADLENERLTEQASLAEFFFEIRGQDAVAKDFQ